MSPTPFTPVKQEENPMTTTTSNNRNLRAAATGYADEALDSGRQFANQAIERAGERARDLREGVKELASRSVDTVSERAAAAQRQLGQYAQATGRYVSDQPVKSALIAAAVGAAVAALVLALRRNSNRADY
jgi:ElaB/YqjD/DUF883 family membrane-anchored ribosome-binding protein